MEELPASPPRCSHSPFPQVVSDDGFVETLAFVEELGDVFRSVLEQVVLQQELDSLQSQKKKVPQCRMSTRIKCFSNNLELRTLKKNVHRSVLTEENSAGPG